jgi:triosephosphate isomerase (TIM)
MAIFGVNLKRFEVTDQLGGICPQIDPVVWITQIVQECVALGLNSLPHPHRLAFFVPESLLLTANSVLAECSSQQSSSKSHKPSESHHGGSMAIGSQGVYRHDIASGGNFGAFTTQLPAAALATMGIHYCLIGHSEERNELFETIAQYDPDITDNPVANSRAQNTVNRIIGQEVRAALKRGLNVVLCIGETAQERGDGPFDDTQRLRVVDVLRSQLEIALECINENPSYLRQITAIAYEPRWAIGPGRPVPTPEYIAFVAGEIHATMHAMMIKKSSDGITNGTTLDIPILYGGGLRSENAAKIGCIPHINGGLIALTRFTPPIGFSPVGLKEIIEITLGGHYEA